MTMQNTNPSKPKRRWYQYSLRSLFVLMALVAVACSWYAVEMQKAAKRRATIDEITKLGGEVFYYDATAPSTIGEPPGRFSWLRKLHGDEYLGNAVAVGLPNEYIADGGLMHLKGLTKLELLCLNGTQITDDRLVYLKGLTNLESLVLCDTQITDAGLVHLKGLTTLEFLNLDGHQITDAGLVHLKGLTNLGYLSLAQTKTTNEGMKKLQKALPNCTISQGPLP